MGVRVALMGDRVGQLVENMTVNLRAAGSNPSKTSASLHSSLHCWLMFSTLDVQLHVFLIWI